MKKILALIVVAMLVLASVSALAAGEYTITIENNSDAMSINGKTYKAYKVFDLTLGDKQTDGSYGAYSYSIKNSDWAFATLTTGATTAADGKITTTYGIVLTPSAADPTVYSVDGTAMTDADARDFADDLTAVLPGTADGQVVASSESATIELNEAGWYAVYGSVKPTDPADSTLDVVAALALTSTDPNATVNPKASVPTVDKKITGEFVLDEAGQAAVAEVGKTVNFEIDSVVPDLTGYDDYTFIIHDTMTSGLTYTDPEGDATNDVVVKIAGADKTAEATIAVDGQTLSVTIPYATLNAAKKGDAIVVTYSAVVNENALTVNYEKNTANVEYSSNPSTDDTNHTPDKEVYVINLNIDVDKVAGSTDGKKLAGAEFKFYKTVEGAKQYYKWADNKVTWVADQADGDTFTTNEQGKLTQQIKGLDQGTYYLEETKAPDGYNILPAPVEVVISASEADDKVTYVATVDGEDATVTDGVIDLKDEQKAQPVATATVINNEGTVLPSTGGIGTTIFYIAGSILVLAAAVLLVTKRRMGADD